MQVEKSMQQYYALRAKEYDQVYAKPERQKDLRNLQILLPKLLTDRKLIEIACGTGYWTQFIADETTSIDAVDASQEVLEIARSRIDNPSVKFHTANAYALPESLGTFEAAFSGFWISHILKSRLRPFLKNLHARLAPNSKVIFLDNLYVEGSSTPVS